MSKKKTVEIMATTVMASPGHRCHSFATFIHDLPAIVGSFLVIHEN
ncbi:hypothetical protein N9D44_01125 [Pontimonas sp.]|nr:hypothetical protein [Pontimonas sp.]